MMMIIPGGRSGCGSSAARSMMFRAIMRRNNSSSGRRRTLLLLPELQWTTAAHCNADGHQLLRHCCSGVVVAASSIIRRRTATTLAGYSGDYHNNNDNVGWWSVDPSVADALRTGRPVVALESTIVAHGMPWPQNFFLAQEVTTILRAHGVEPATIAIKDGQCKIGLSLAELEDLARAGSSNRARKCSTRELATVLCRTTTTTMTNANANEEKGTTAQWGATTVAATMRLAHLAGIETFVTGGIGGVHRGVESTLDISADLTELARTPVIVVSAGVKSILDIPRTLEVLETNGVSVISYRCDEFPAFFTAASGVRSPERMDTAADIATSFLISRDRLRLPNGMLVAVPNVDDDADGAQIEAAIQTAVKEAAANTTGVVVTGRDVTPYILKRVNELTHGASLRCNMALVKQNARVGAEIAIEIARQKKTKSAVSFSSSPSRKHPPHQRITVPPGSWSASSARGGSNDDDDGYDDDDDDSAVSNDILRSDVIVIGGAIIDVMARPTTGHGPLLMATSNPAICTESDGGVARNVAETLGRLGSRPLFYSAVGNDHAGRSLLDRLQDKCGVLNSHRTVSIVPHCRTARYVAVLDHDGDLAVACADVDVLDHGLSVLPDDDTLAAAQYLVLDANLPKHVIACLAQRAVALGTCVVFEPTSVPKATDVDSFLKYVSLAFPNQGELEAMVNHPDKRSMTMEQQMANVLARMHLKSATLIVTAGKDGVHIGVRSDDDTVQFSHFPVARVVPVANATGAGDTLVGAFLHARLQNQSLDQAITFGMKAAAISLQCHDAAVSPNLAELQERPL